MRRILIPLVALLPLVACGSSPTDPSSPGGSTVLHGQTVSAVDGGASPNLNVQIGARSLTSDGSGFFQIDLGNPGAHRAFFRGSSVVERETRVTPKSDVTLVSMIPSSFDLGAFDEMFRFSNSRLQRWTSRPSLVLLASVMDYRNGSSDNNYEATGEQLTDDDVAQMLTHLTEGLALLTGGTYTSFASVDVERPAAGARVNVLRSGRIVVGRYNGIVTFGVKVIGYGQWSETNEGAIVAGSTFLDRDFDRGDSRRRLLRIHELGHALGYQHVTSRTSIMNPSIGPQPTDFDRAGAKIAFQRPIGNKAPDIDPSTSTLAAATGEARTAGPTVCR
jgi:hypothetical protein